MVHRFSNTPNRPEEEDKERRMLHAVFHSVCRDVGRVLIVPATKASLFKLEVQLVDGITSSRLTVALRTRQEGDGRVTAVEAKRQHATYQEEVPAAAMR